MMAEEPKKNQYPAYAVKSDDGKLKNVETRDEIICRAHSSIR